MPVLSPRELALGAVQGLLIASGLGAAIFVPRAGDPAVLVPLGAQPIAKALAYAEAERAPVMTIDTATRRLVVLAPDSAGLIRALARGFVLVAAAKDGCAERQGGITE